MSITIRLDSRPTRVARASLTLGLVIAATALASCGSDDSTSTAATPVPTSAVATADTTATTATTASTPAAVTASTPAATTSTSTTSGSGTPLSHADLISRADAICRKAQAQSAARAQASPKDVSAAAKALRALSPSAADAATWKEFTDAETEAARLYAKSTHQQGTAADTTLSAVQQAGSAAIAAATKLGATDCAK